MKNAEYEKIKTISQNIIFDSYWCSKCDRLHRKFTSKGRYSMIFVKHSKTKIGLTPNQLLIKRMKKNLSKYNKSKEYKTLENKINKDINKLFK